MHDALMIAFENTIYDTIGYKITPMEATELAAALLANVRKLLDERLQG